MGLDWDVLLDGVSIKEQIAEFNIRESKGAYARELSLFAAEPAFYDQFSGLTFPTPRVEVRIKTGETWVSQGLFYIEQPGISASPDMIASQGIWGRSKTAAAGEPFAVKVSKTWSDDTTFFAIVNEMVALCGLSVVFEIDDYMVHGGSYVADDAYPIDVISELAEFAGAVVSCTLDGDLAIKPDVFHPAAADHTITDIDIADISESIERPEFGNRIRISSAGNNSGYQVSMEALDDADCLPADGTATSTLLAFVTDQGQPAPDNTMVAWTADPGVTLRYPQTGTGRYLLNSRKHRAENYYSVTVDFPIAEVIGIWAYADSGDRKNFWDPDTDRVEGNKITVQRAFAFCDQMLRITYITAGCAVNVISAGTTARDIEVTADVAGRSDNMDIKLGNTCACGSSLNAKINPPDSICLGNLAHILIWATINQVPAAGHKIEARLTKGCGILSSENKTLKTASILNEAAYVENIVSGISQVSTELDISGAQLPSVYAETDTGKTNNLYASYDGKVIDLDTKLPTGTKVLINYHADGATLISWRTLGATKDCSAEVTISMPNGTEAGLNETISLRARDCTVSSNAIPDNDEDISDYDPRSDDQSSDNEGGFSDDGNGVDTETSSGADGCLPTIMDRLLNAENAIDDEERDAIRFGTKAGNACPEGGEFSCPCSELCSSEVMERGSIYGESQTIHEIVSADHEEGTPEYNEAFEALKTEKLAQCETACEDNRLDKCGGCGTAVGPLTLAPGESAEYVCTDGTVKLITMPEGHCGVLTETVGCCKVEIRSTLGEWDSITCTYGSPGFGVPMSLVGSSVSASGVVAQFTGENARFRATQSWRASVSAMEYTSEAAACAAMGVTGSGMREYYCGDLPVGDIPHDLHHNAGGPISMCSNFSGATQAKIFDIDGNDKKAVGSSCQWYLATLQEWKCPSE